MGGTGEHDTDVRTFKHVQTQNEINSVCHMWTYYFMCIIILNALVVAPLFKFTSLSLTFSQVV